MEHRTKKHRQPPNPNPNPVKFIHFRYTNEDQTPTNNGGVTIAYRDSVASPGCIEAAWSRCNLSDNFCKKVGRDIAVGNLDFDNYYALEVDPSKDDVYSAIVNFFTHKLKDYHGFQSTTTHRPS